MASMSVALITHKRITTTLPKAKALRIFVEPIINKAKEDSTHNRRQAFRYLRDKHAVTELFENVSSRIADRPGGYCRIVKLGQRAGDSAEMAMIELVDYNDVRPEGSSGGRTKKTRRAGRRRSSGGATSSGAAKTVEDTVESAVDTVEDAVNTAADAVADVVEDTADAVVSTVEEVAEKATGIDESDEDDAKSAVADDPKSDVVDDGSESGKKKDA